MDASKKVDYFYKKNNKKNKIKSQIELQEEFLNEVVELSMAIDQINKELANDEPPPLPEQIR